MQEFRGSDPLALTLQSDMFGETASLRPATAAETRLSCVQCTWNVQSKAVDTCSSPPTLKLFDQRHCWLTVMCWHHTPCSWLSLTPRPLCEVAGLQQSRRVHWRCLLLRCRKAQDLEPRSGGLATVCMGMQIPESAYAEGKRLTPVRDKEKSLSCGKD